MAEQEEILIVDDTPIIQRSLLMDILIPEGFHVRSANNGEMALRAVASKPPNLILLNINMPGTNGFEVCRRLKTQEENSEIPVLFISDSPSLEEKRKGFELGAVDFISKPFQREEILARVRTYLELSRLRNKLEAQVAERTTQLPKSAEEIEINERKKKEEELKRSFDKLHKIMGGIIQATTLAVESRDPNTAGHQRRVANLARSIGQEMGLIKDRVEAIRTAGMVHDLGKISIPAEILSKPTKLSSLEYSLIRIHPQISYDILKNIDFPWPIAEIVFQHHERINGSGYPLGIKDGEILPEAKVLMVADVVEAISSHRPYRPSYGIDVALEKISTNGGRLYDPEVVNSCLKLFRDKGFQLE